MNQQQHRAFCKAFGAHVRTLRLGKGYGMREFALLADIEYSQLSKIERGVTNPTISTVLTLAKALQVPHAKMFAFTFSEA